MLNDMRKGFIGVVEVDDLADENVSIHFNEWWNGEGMDFAIDSRSKNLTFSLTIEQWHAIAAIGVATGYLELDEVERRGKSLIASSEQRARRISEIREKYQRGEY